MGAITSNLKLIVAAIAATVTFSLPAGAQEGPSRALLDKLRSADATEAASLERELRLEWSKSGSPAMDLLLKRGQDALEVEDTDAALEHLTALTDHAPDFAEGWHARAKAYYMAGLYGPALSDLERALTLNPGHFGAIYGLGLILEQMGRDDAAYDAYSAVLTIHPNHQDAAEGLQRLQARVNGIQL